MPSSMLIVHAGATAYTVTPAHGATIGRAPDCDIVIDDPHISHHHARATLTHEGWVLEDLGSANGMFVNGVHVTRILIESPTTISLSRNVAITCTPLRQPTPNPNPPAVASAPVPAPTQLPPAQPIPLPADTVPKPPTARHAIHNMTPNAPTSAIAGAGRQPVPAPLPQARPIPLPRTRNANLYGTVMAGSPQAQLLESRMPAQRVFGRFDPNVDRTGVLGRDPSSVIHINDRLVSRRHCSLEATPNGILLTDLDSANGTYVNGRRVAKIWLEADDTVTVGNTDLTVHDGVLCDRTPFMASEAVIAENVGLVVGKNVRLLDGVNAVFAKGTLTAVIGPSGAGKSTFTSIVAGLGTPSEGHVLFDGYDVHRNIELLRSRIGFVPQDDVVHRKLTVDAALEYAARLRLPASTKAERAEIIDNVLQELELTDRRRNRIDRLSGGQRKRVSTAIELLTGPELLILDEPTSGLDPALDLTVMTMLRRLADAGRVVIVVTHSLSYIDRLCDNVLMLAPGGRPAFFGTTGEMRQAFGDKDWADIFNDVTESPDTVYSITETEQLTQQAKRLTSPRGGHDGRSAFDGRDARGGHNGNSGNGKSGGPDASNGSNGRNEHGKRMRSFRFRQMLTLVTRQLHLIAADPVLLVFLLLLPLLLGLLSLVVPGSHGLGEPDFKDAATEPSQLLSLVILGACFMGSALSVRDIISERAIYDRERAVGLSPTSYTLSKLIVMGCQTLLQAAMLITAVMLGKPGPDSGVLTDSGVPELFLAVWLTAWASAMLGEIGSALVKSGEQTMPLLVILVMAQLVFSGGMIPVTGRDGLEQVAMVFPGRWGFSAAASDIGLNKLLYGLDKVPTFDKDDLWRQTAAQFRTDIVVLAAMVVVFTLMLRVCVSNVVSKRIRR
ncbi:FHA domain-containing protein [Bifidobacterium sp. CP2]|uniref:FHA domain-containing protein n=1 Tax=Bifidobacterium sp. CP2 TaxID=2809025 RepID=UPI001BDC2176|nr:FHA domain-containing protein [Bifidobacterium sp. CP2]MBT1182402.1 FHA domain-containing protein [Bifidobacterium sp. CP2]